MLKLLGLGALAFAGHRGYMAQKAGVPIDEALMDPFKPLAEMKTVGPVTESAQEDIPARDSLAYDAIMVPEWLQEFGL